MRVPNRYHVLNEEIRDGLSLAERAKHSLINLTNWYHNFDKYPHLVFDLSHPIDETYRKMVGFFFWILELDRVPILYG